MKFELRTLSATDIFPMCNILSKIGIKEFRNCLQSEEVKKMISGNKGKGNEFAVGISVMFEVGNVILSNISKCENDLYNFLASVANVTVDDIKSLSMGEFVELIIEVVKKPEFADFFKVVSRLFNQKN